MAPEAPLPPEARLPWHTLVVALAIAGVPGLFLSAVFSQGSWGSRYWGVLPDDATVALISAVALTVADRLAAPSFRPLSWAIAASAPWLILGGVVIWASRGPGLQILAVLVLPATGGLALAIAARASRGLPWLLPLAGGVGGAVGALLATVLYCLPLALTGQAALRQSLDVIPEFLALAAPSFGLVGLIVGLCLHFERKRIALHGG
jgi:hypothetical protein